MTAAVVAWPFSWDVLYVNDPPVAWHTRCLLSSTVWHHRHI